MLNRIINKIKSTLESYKRILIIARKPDRESFYETLRICLIAMAIIGFMGFVFYAISIIFLG